VVRTYLLRQTGHGAESRARGAVVERGELLAKGEILKGEISVGPKGRTQRAKKGNYDGEHRVDDASCRHGLAMLPVSYPYGRHRRESCSADVDLANHRLCKHTFLTTQDPQKRKKPRISWASVERAMGLEPTTFTLAISRYTAKSLANT